MVKLKLEDNEVEQEDNSPMQPAAESLGIPFGCQNGMCGTCIVEVQEGMENLSAKNEKEEDFGLEDSQRLACQCTMKSGSIKIDF